MTLLSIELVALITIAFVAGVIVVYGLDVFKRTMVQNAVHQKMQQQQYEVMAKAETLPDIAPHGVLTKSLPTMAETVVIEKRVQKVEPRFDVSARAARIPDAEPVLLSKQIAPIIEQTAPEDEKKHESVKIPDTKVETTSVKWKPASSHPVKTTPIKAQAEDTVPLKNDKPIGKIKILSTKAEKKARERALIAAAKSQPFIDSDGLKLDLF